MKRKSSRLSGETACNAVEANSEITTGRHKRVLCDSNGMDTSETVDTQELCTSATTSLSNGLECFQQQCNGVENSLTSNHVTGSPESQEAHVNSDGAAILPKLNTPSNTPNLNTIISDVVNKRMRDEEEKLQKLNAEKEEEATKSFLQEWEVAEEKEKEGRYQKLQLLLTKSELYTKYLLERMGQQKQLAAEAQSPDSSQPPAKKAKKSKQSAEEGNTSLDGSASMSQQSQASEQDKALSSGCPLLFVGTLRPYQVDGLIWLNTMFENGVNGILADEMGLGKTVQCIAALAHLITMDVRGPFLIVVPLSTLPNWVNEFKRFAPKVPVMLYHGSKPAREEMRKDMYKSTLVDGQWWTQPVVCTSYEVAMADSKQIMSMNWKYLIVDEGHRIKNSQCRLIKALRLYDSTHRVLLTGTPLQNNLSELWSLLNFLLPEVFDDLDSFEYWFQLDCLKKDQQKQFIAEEKKRNVLAMLHKIMTPFILRRLKCDVELNLPPKQEILVYAPLTNQQRTYYEATLNMTIHQLLDKVEGIEKEVAVAENGDGRKPRRSSTKKVNYALQMIDGKDDDDCDIESWVDEISDLTASTYTPARAAQKLGTHVHGVKLANRMMQLRKCCSHPYLMSQPIDPETGYCKIDEEVINSSGKMLLLDAMLSELKKRGHKVLIFSQMTKMLDLIEDYCHVRRHEYCRLDGSTDINDRREQMERFNSDPTYFLFLLSTRAGGLGINLCAADTVIIFDSDWNPQCDLQAQDRAHRIGQSKPVVVYRLVCANTIDEQVVERAARKRRLEKMVIHKEKFKTGMTMTYTETCKSITQDELLDLLKSHDYDAVVEMANRKEVISKRELNALLDRSSLIDQWKAYTGQQNGEGKAKKGNKAKGGKRSVSSSANNSAMRRAFKVVDDGKEEPKSE